jgi:ribosomal protein S8
LDFIQEFRNTRKPSKKLRKYDTIRVYRDMNKTEQNISLPEQINVIDSENKNSLLERLEKISKTQIRTYNQIESIKKKIKRDLDK